MDEQRFDHLARTFAQSSSRRSVLKGILGGAAGGVLALLGQGGAAAAPGGNGNGNGNGGGGGTSKKPDCCPASAPRLCDTQCVDVDTDPNNCGGCGQTCASGVCANGVCGTGCRPGTTQSCYDGPSGTLGVGICQAGVQTCQADGTWGPCQGEITPQPETCNGLDDNCDGLVDTNACAAGLTCCSGSGGCVDLNSNASNCGACGQQCAPGIECVGGICGAGTSCDDGNICTADILNPDGTCTHTPVLSGSPCQADTCIGPTTLQTQCVCDGAGNCVCTPQSCAPYHCVSNACLTTCATDGDCDAGFFCLGSACVPMRPSGESCSADDQCISGACSGGLCI